MDIVARYFRSFGDNKSLPLRMPSQKLALLMALVEASMVSELQALDLQHWLYCSEGVVFTMTGLGKKRTVGASPKQVMLGTFPNNDYLCVVKCLRQYEAVILQYRNKDLDTPWPLLLSSVKPHGPVTSQHLAHWLKEILGKAGVEISVFKAHSVQGASSTIASERGCLLRKSSVQLIGAQILPFGGSIVGFHVRTAIPKPSFKRGLPSHRGYTVYGLSTIVLCTWCHLVVFWTHIDCTILLYVVWSFIFTWAICLVYYVQSILCIVTDVVHELLQGHNISGKFGSGTLEIGPEVKS